MKKKSRKRSRKSLRKRPNGDGSIFQDGKAWKAVISLGVIGGKRIRRVRRAKTRDEALEKLKKLRTELSLFFEVPEDMLVSELMSRWLEKAVKPNRKTATYSSYRRAVENHIVPVIGMVKSSKLRPVHIEEVLSHLPDGSRTRENAYHVCSVCFKYARNVLKLIEDSPCNSIPKPQYVKKRNIIPFTESEVKGIFEATEYDRLHGVYRLAFTTGLRQGEIFGLYWSKVLWEENKIHIDLAANEVDGRIYLEKPKNWECRVIEVTPSVMSALEERRKTSMREGSANSNFVFTNRSGNVIRRSNFRSRQWKPLLKKLGINHRGFHHARHTAITMMLNGGTPAHQVSRYIGHKDVTTTLNTYAHLITGEQSQAVMSMKKRFG